MSQRNQNPQRQYRDNEESALSSLRELVAQLTRREPNTPCDTLEEGECPPSRRSGEHFE